MQATCWQHAGNMLATCWQHPGNMLPTCWQHAGNILATCWQHAVQHAGNMLTTSWYHASNKLPTCWQHAGNMLVTSWQHAGNMLATYWQHAGNMLATCWCPEAIITETEDPFENCPLSSSSSVTPYSLLLGARLGAICAQKDTIYNGREICHFLSLPTNFCCYSAWKCCKHLGHG